MSRQFRHGWGYNDSLVGGVPSATTIVPSPPAGVTRLVEVVRFSYVRAGSTYHWLVIVDDGVTKVVHSRLYTSGSYVLRGPWVIESHQYMALSPLLVSNTSGYAVAEWSER